MLAARAQKKPGAKNKLQLAAKLAAAAQRAVRLPTVPEEAELDEDEPPAPPEPPETEQQQRKRQRQRHTSWSGQSLKRSTIHYFYMMLNEPSELEWDGAGGTVLQIRDMMLLPRGETEAHQDDPPHAQGHLLWRGLRRLGARAAREQGALDVRGGEAHRRRRSHRGMG